MPCSTNKRHVLPYLKTNKQTKRCVPCPTVVFVVFPTGVRTYVRTWYFLTRAFTLHYLVGRQYGMVHHSPCTTCRFLAYGIIPRELTNHTGPSIVPAARYSARGIVWHVPGAWYGVRQCGKQCGMVHRGYLSCIRDGTPQPVHTAQCVPCSRELTIPGCFHFGPPGML